MPIIIDESHITAEQDAAIRELLCLCFPRDRAVFSQTRAWNGSAPSFSAIIDQQGQIIAQLGVVDRSIRIGSASVRIAGIQNVAVHSAHRGRRLTAETLRAALIEARMRRFDAALLFCIPALEAMYARSGFLPIPPAAITRIHNGQATTLPAHHSTLYFPLGLPSFPAGDIHLMGDDW